MYDDAWDDMSSEYDNCVENNTNPVISNYITEEIKIIANLCKKVVQHDKKFTIIDMGCGTGRVLFSLQKILGDSISFFGLDASESMIQLSKEKQAKLTIENIKFLNYNITNPKIDELFENDSIKIPMCVYNTIGVIPIFKRKQFFDNMLRLAGKDGFALISAFNGDNFAFAAPQIYHPMKNMVKRIDDDSFDEEKLAFKNSLGYYSQWFKKNQLKKFLKSEVEPIPIKVSINEKTHVLGHVFVDRELENHT
ncbi:MAG: class I SAM-dependent methyltransferase [Nitrosopumilus sp.]|nr:class I SAM-dependent methyltransferase [Nitrosopumilus sp.]NNL58912.1 class I SAM-dependent methyltransferase [Nitrosopumilus sp.]